MTIKMSPDFSFMIRLLLLQQEAGLIEETEQYANFLVTLIEETTK